MKYPNTTKGLFNFHNKQKHFAKIAKQGRIQYGMKCGKNMYESRKPGNNGEPERLAGERGA